MIHRDENSGYRDKQFTVDSLQGIEQFAVPG